MINRQGRRTKVVSILQTVVAENSFCRATEIPTRQSAVWGPSSTGRKPRLLWLGCAVDVSVLEDDVVITRGRIYLHALRIGPASRVLGSSGRPVLQGFQLTPSSL